jgi:pimeloyl-ACP methyl ester carboxylesterase
MTHPDPQFLSVGDGPDRRRIAYIDAPRPASTSPGLFWLSGLKSEMTSTKATAMAEWAATAGVSATRFDYSGHGLSECDFESGTISRWLAEARAIFESVATGPRVLVGSSMGGYIALLLLRELLAKSPADAARIHALVLIAPAWDMTERLMWQNFSRAARAEIEEKGVFARPSEYGSPYMITRALIEDGRKHLIGDTGFNPGRPIFIMHGLLDPDVPWEHTLELEADLSGDWVRVEAVPDGEHRLSRPEDLALLFRLLAEAIAR